MKLFLKDVSIYISRLCKKMPTPAIVGQPHPILEHLNKGQREEEFLLAWDTYLPPPLSTEPYQHGWLSDVMFITLPTASCWCCFPLTNVLMDPPGSLLVP